MKETVFKLLFMTPLYEVVRFFFLILVIRDFCISGCKYTFKIHVA